MGSKHDAETIARWNVILAAREVADGAALEFSDPRISYETWQVNAGAMNGLFDALKAFDALAEER